MALLSLPNEIIIEIGEMLDREADIYALVLVNKRFYHLFDDHLYRYNIKHRRCQALFWAAKQGRESTARKLLHLGADVNINTQQARSNETRIPAGLTPLHLAASKGHLAIVKLLLQVGADPEATVEEKWTPLFFALIARHGEVARHISRCTSNLQSCLVESTKRLTPLHLACHLGLWSCARYFLNEGADVDAIDANAMTPLHHALLINVGGQPVPGPDEIFETVKVLLEFKADRNLESRPRSGTEPHGPIAAYVCGSNHPYGRVRALFSDCANDSLHITPSHRPSSLQIGRPWMRSSLSGMSGEERDGANLMYHTTVVRSLKSYRGVRTSGERKAQPDNLDPSFFPVLNSDSQPQISSLRTQFPEGPWSPSSIDSLIAGFSFNNEPDTPPTAEDNPFPKLNSHIARNPLETEAGKLWADLGKPKSHPLAEDAFFSSGSNEKNSLPEMECTKTRGKTRWQPLKF